MTKRGHPSVNIDIEDMAFGIEATSIFERTDPGSEGFAPLGVDESVVLGLKKRTVQHNCRGVENIGVFERDMFEVEWNF